MNSLPAHAGTDPTSAVEHPTWCLPMLCQSAGHGEYHHRGAQQTVHLASEDAEVSMRLAGDAVAPWVELQVVDTYADDERVITVEVTEVDLRRLYVVLSRLLEQR